MFKGHQLRHPIRWGYSAKWRPYMYADNVLNHFLLREIHLQLGYRIRHDRHIVRINKSLHAPTSAVLCVGLMRQYNKPLSRSQTGAQHLWLAGLINVILSAFQSLGCYSVHINWRNFKFGCSSSISRSITHGPTLRIASPARLKLLDIPTYRPCWLDLCLPTKGPQLQCNTHSKFGHNGCSSCKLVQVYYVIYGTSLSGSLPTVDLSLNETGLSPSLFPKGFRVGCWLSSFTTGNSGIHGAFVVKVIVGVNIANGWSNFLINRIAHDINRWTGPMVVMRMRRRSCWRWRRC